MDLREIYLHPGADGFVAVFLADLRDCLLDRRVVQVIQQMVGNSISTYRTEYTTRDITIQEKKRFIRLTRMLPEQKSAIESDFHTTFF